MKRTFFFGRIKGVLVWAILVATPFANATAAPMLVKAPPPPAAFSWAGFYIGANAGGTWGNMAPGFADSDIGNYLTFGAGQTTNLGLVNSVGTMSFSNGGAIVGGQIGYLWQLNAIVFGGEADLQYFNPKGLGAHVGAYSDGVPFAFNESTSGSWLATFRARIGVPVNHFLFYVTPGIAVARLSFNSSFADAETSPPRVSAGLASNLSSTQTRFGPAIGGGIEYAFNNHWSIRAEDIYVQFDHLGGAASALPTSGVVNPPAFFSLFNYAGVLRDNIVRGAINYRF